VGKYESPNLVLGLSCIIVQQRSLHEALGLSEGSLHHVNDPAIHALEYARLQIIQVSIVTKQLADS